MAASYNPVILLIPFLLVAPDPVSARTHTRQFGNISCDVGGLGGPVCRDPSGKVVPPPLALREELAREEASQLKKRMEEVRKRCSETTSAPAPTFPRSTLCEGQGGIPSNLDTHFQKELPKHYAILKNTALAQIDRDLVTAARASLTDKRTAPEPATGAEATRRVTPEQARQREAGAKEKARAAGGFQAQVSHVRKLIQLACAEKRKVEEKVRGHLSKLSQGNHQETADIYKASSLDVRDYQTYVGRLLRDWGEEMPGKLPYLSDLVPSDAPNEAMKTLRQEFAREAQTQWHPRSRALQPLSEPLTKEQEQYEDFSRDLHRLGRDAQECRDNMGTAR